MGQDKKNFKIFRKIAHILFGATTIILYLNLNWFTNISNFNYNQILNLFIIFYLILFFVSFFTDIVRIIKTRINTKIYKHLSLFFSEDEKKQINSATFFILSIILCALLFRRNIFISSLLFITLGDSLSSFIGYYFGTIKIKKKYLISILSSIIINFVIATIFFDILISITISVITGIVDLLSDKNKYLDDNLTIPIISGFSLTFLSVLLN